MIKYELFLGEIKKIEIKKETPTRVYFLDGNWRNKHSEFCHYFDTEKEAVTYRLNKKKSKMNYLSKMIEGIKDDIDILEERLKEL